AALFIGPESYERAKCRQAIAVRVPQIDHFDLDETPLSIVLDDARSLSLFASERAIWVASAESALPNARAASDASDADLSNLRDYLHHPTPGVAIVFDCSRFDFEGDDKAKIDRVLKFYSAIPDAVEFR